MKYTDNYDAKLEIWARESKVYPMPKIVGLPHFGAKKFNSYEELRQWKQSFLNEIAAKGGVQWTK